MSWELIELNGEDNDVIMFKNLVSEIDISKYDQTEFINVVNSIYYEIFISQEEEYKIKIYEVESITTHLEVEIEDDWDCICGFTSTITFKYPKNLWDSFECNFCDEKLVIVEPILIGESYSKLLTENNLQLDESGYGLEPIDGKEIKLTENNKQVGELIYPGDEMDGATLCDWCNMHFKGDGDLERCNTCYEETR